ncbi:MAG: hypothetical protein JST19_10530 [Bacteroidetes bacterium]|nr:hypothetical protein [Bacteroidota bacterium]
MKVRVILSFLVISSTSTVFAQNAYFKLGQQAFLDGDFKSAVSHLERSCIIDSTNASALWMLGYSYYHSDSYKKSIAAFTRVISIKPADASAYYYRARAEDYLSKETQLTDAEREKNLLGAIVDFSKAIAIDPNNTQDNIKYYQNRGIAYREYGEFRLLPGTRFYDRSRAINSLKASIADLEKVLSVDPSRQDISTLMELSKVKLAAATAIHR